MAMAQRNHYVPEFYLKGFCSENGILTVYEKPTGAYFEAPPSRVAVVKGFYSLDLERYLSENIEEPANAVLAKIRSEDTLSADDKVTLAKYIVTMWKRVPRARRRLHERALKVSEELRTEIRAQFSTVQARDPSKEEIVKERLRQADEILDRLASDPPDEVFYRIILSEATPRLVAAAAAMTWVFLVTDDTLPFSSCDNPVFIFERLGIGRPESELSFPVSSHVALWGSWRPMEDRTYLKAPPQLVKELWRRAAHNAERYLYHHRFEPWIPPFLRKGAWRLCRVP
jgi:hypothetical protein